MSVASDRQPVRGQRVQKDRAAAMNVREMQRLQKQLLFLEKTQKADLRRRDLEEKLLIRKHGYIFKVPTSTDSHLSRSAINRFRNLDDNRSYPKETQLYSNLVSSHRFLFNSDSNMGGSFLPPLTTSQPRTSLANQKSPFNLESHSTYSCHDTIWEKELIGSAKNRHYSMLQEKRQSMMLDNLRDEQKKIALKQEQFYNDISRLIPGGDTSLKAASKINSLGDLILLVNFCIPKDEDLTKSQQRMPQNSKMKWKKAVKTIKLDPFQFNKRSFQITNQKK